MNSREEIIIARRKKVALEELEYKNLEILYAEIDIPVTE